MTSIRLGDDEVGPYVLRPLLDSVPLSEDGSQEDIQINCVEYYGACVLGLMESCS